MKEKLKKKIEPIIEKSDFKLREVELGTRKGKRAVIVTISGDDLSVDDCAEISRKIESEVESVAPFDGESYSLVVTSPGS